MIGAALARVPGDPHPQAHLHISLSVVTRLAGRWLARRMPGTPVKRPQPSFSPVCRGSERPARCSGARIAGGIVLRRLAPRKRPLIRAAVSRPSLRRGAMRPMTSPLSRMATRSHDDAANNTRKIRGSIVCQKVNPTWFSRVHKPTEIAGGLVFFFFFRRISTPGLRGGGLGISHCLSDPSWSPAAVEAASRSKRTREPAAIALHPVRCPAICHLAPRWRGDRLRTDLAKISTTQPEGPLKQSRVKQPELDAALIASCDRRTLARG